MELVRFRKGYASQDIQRTQVQQQFLKALAKQCLSVSSLTKIGEFADIFAEYVTTSLTTGNMVWFGKELLACDFDSMQCCTAEGEGAMINGAAYYPLYAGRLLETVNACFNPYDAPIAAGTLNVVTPEQAYAYQKAPDPEPEAPKEPEQTDEPQDAPEEPEIQKIRMSRRNPAHPSLQKTPSRTVRSGKNPIQIRKEHKNHAQCKRSGRARGKGARRQNG